MTAKSAMLLVLVLVLVDLALFPLLIAWLRRMRFTQLIRDEGPVSHKSKAGTPTGGGLMLVLNIVGVMAVYVFVIERSASAMLDVATLVFVVVSLVSGFLDDWTKEFKHRSDGLLGYQKLLDPDSGGWTLFYLAYPSIIPTLHLASGAVLLGWLGFLRFCHAVRSRHGECIQPDGRP